MSEQIDNETESSVVSVPNVENEVEITNGDAKMSDPQTPTSAAQPPQLAPPPPDGPPPGVPPQPPAPPQPPPQISDEICKDSMRGNCVRTVCKYKHQKPKPIFCHNFQNHSQCSIAKCNYIHGTIKDEIYYNTHGVLPPHLLENDEDVAKLASSKPTSSTAKPSVKPITRYPNHKKAAPRGPAPRSAVPNPPQPRLVAPDSPITGFHNYPPIIDPSVPPPFPVYYQSSDGVQNSYAGVAPLDFNAIKHLQPPKIFKQGANSTETSTLTWNNFNGKLSKKDNIENIGAAEVCTKTYSSQNDLDEPPTKKTKFSKCESCVKINDRYEDMKVEFKETEDMLTTIKNKNNSLILNIMKLIVEMYSLIKVNDSETFYHCLQKNDRELPNSMSKIDVNLHGESNNSTSTNVMHSQIMASNLDGSATNSMLSNYMSNDLPNTIIVNQQGQPVGNVMGANEYLRPVQMNNQNSFSGFPYNAQKNHIQNVTPTTIDVSTTNQNQQFAQQYILQGKNIPQTFVNTYASMRT